MMTQAMSQSGQTIPASHNTSAEPLSHYRVEMPADLLDEQGAVIDWLIGFAFDTLGARVLELRVVGGAHTSPAISSYPS